MRAIGSPIKRLAVKGKDVPLSKKKRFSSFAVVS
jgi:hypothetical protein